MPRKRHRTTGSGGHVSPPPLSVLDRIVSEFKACLASSFPPERDGELACPFVKHNPEVYKHVGNACTQTGHANISTLKEHIKRVHLLKYSCRRCKSRFTESETNLAGWKERHKCDRTRKPRQNSEVEITTEEQDERYLNLNFRVSGAQNGGEAFKQIFHALWPEIPKADIPDGYFKPGFFYSMPVITAALEKAVQNLRAGAISDQSPNETPTGGSYMAPGAPVPPSTLSPLPMPSSHTRRFLFNDAPYAAGLNGYDGSHVDITERAPHLFDPDFILGNSRLEPQGPGLPISHLNIETQQHPDPPLDSSKVAQTVSFVDSGFQNDELDEMNTAYPLTEDTYQGPLEPDPDFFLDHWPWPPAEHTGTNICFEDNSVDEEADEAVSPTY